MRGTPPRPRSTGERSLPALLEEWVTAGLISPDQAQAIRAHERQPSDTGEHVPPDRAAPAHPIAGPVAGRPTVPTAGPASLVVEALGYLGGIIMLVGATILTSFYWQDLPTAARLLLLGVTALALVVAGVAVPDRLGDAALRLRSVLWALAVAATIAFMVVFTSDVLDRQDEASLIVVGPCAALVAGVLWWFRRTWLQQVALLMPLVLSAAGLAYEVAGTGSHWYGGFAWLVAAGWSVLAYAGRLPPRISGFGLGGLVATFSALAIGTDLGVALALATAATLVAVALRERSLPWLAVAAVAVLQTMPRAAVEWFPGRLSASLTLIMTGGLLVAAAVWVARHQAERRPRPQAPREMPRGADPSGPTPR